VGDEALVASVETGAKGERRLVHGGRSGSGIYRGVLPVVCTADDRSLAITPTDPFIEALRLGLREPKRGRYPGVAAELVRRKIDVM